MPRELFGTATKGPPKIQAEQSCAISLLNMAEEAAKELKSTFYQFEQCPSYRTELRP
jgi:hypothetical protein